MMLFFSEGKGTICIYHILPNTRHAGYSMRFHAIGIKFKYPEKIPEIFQFSKLSLQIPKIPENSWISGEVETLPHDSFFLPKQSI